MFPPELAQAEDALHGFWHLFTAHFVLWHKLEMTFTQLPNHPEESHVQTKHWTSERWRHLCSLHNKRGNAAPGAQVDLTPNSGPSASHATSGYHGLGLPASEVYWPLVSRIKVRFSFLSFIFITNSPSGGCPGPTLEWVSHSNLDYCLVSYLAPHTH